MTETINNWPVFILGTQRSGTTLLTRVLSAHPKIFIQNELELPHVFSDEQDTNTVVANIQNEIFKQGQVDLTDYTSQKDHVWGLKDPQLTEHISTLKNFLPHSKFIIIVRDARGVTNSYMENKWGLGTNAYTGAQRWHKEVTQQIEFMNTAPENFLFVRYEDMIENLEGTIKKVCCHIDVEFDEEMMSYNQTSSYYGANRENIHTFKKPDMQLTKKWMKKLSSHQIDIVEHITHNLLQQLNYSLIGKEITLSFFERLYYKIHQAIIGELQIQYRWRKFRLKEAIKK